MTRPSEFLLMKACAQHKNLKILEIWPIFDNEMRMPESVVSFNKDQEFESVEKQSRVLVVDDEPTICSLMNVFLTQKGYRVQTASSGEDALVLFEKAFPDIVLLDISMPGMRGIDVLRRMK